MTNPTVPLPDDVTVLPGEQVIKIAEFHWGIYWKGLGVLALALFLCLYQPNLGIFLLLVAAIMLGIAYMTKHYLLLILTNRRLLIRSGLIRMDTVQLPLERIESVELGRTIPGMIMGYADVIVTGTGSRIVAVSYVDQPQVFRRLVDGQLYAKNQTPPNGTAL